MPTTIYILPLISIFVGLGAAAIAKRTGLIDDPGQAHKTHDRPTPLVGGFAVALPILVYCGLSVWQDPQSVVYLALLCIVGGAFVMGVIDDRTSLPSPFRLIYGASLAFASTLFLPAFVVTQFDFTFLAAPLPLAPFAVAFTILVTVGMMNAINMADGMNGLAGGLCLIWSLFLLVYAPANIFPLVLLLVFCLAVTLLFNLTGKLFFGDSGTYAAGMTISLLTIYTYNETPDRLYADAVVAWFIVPVVDCLRLMAARAIQGRSPMSPDKDHLHHRLQRLMPKWCAVMSYWLLVAVPGALAIAVPTLTLPAVLGATGVYLGLLIISSRRKALGRDAAQPLGIAGQVPNQPQ